MKIPSYGDVVTAHRRIKPFINKTPVLTSSYLNNLLKCELFFKCENFQKVGAFKYRGATNAMLSLSREELQRGVATHSSGNHAQALALAAKTFGSRATIIMPKNSPIVKQRAVAGYGADIIFCEPTLESRQQTLQEFVDKTGAIFIHPYNKFEIICGQATAAKELIEEVGWLDYILVPVGGGGLLSGTAVVTKTLMPNASVVAAEPSGADDAARSFRSGKLQLSVSPQTIADGLRTSLGELTFEIIKHYVDDIITETDENIIQAMKLIWERMKIIIEPSSAVPIAAVISNQGVFEGKRVGIIISGGNVDLDNLPW
jgi:threonine dehydratase